VVLLDTSMWIEALREGGRTESRRRVDELLAADEAIWCDVIRLELWHGARGEKEHDRLRYLESVIRCLETDQRVWDESFDLARRARARGLTVGVPDLIIVACANRHGVPVESRDAHVERLLKLG
jgi:predicted nucleic acid-binding protein